MDSDNTFVIISGHALEDKEEEDIQDSGQKKKKKKSKTVARTLLEDAINGHKLILKELDEYLVETPIKSEEETKKQEVNLNAKDYSITINLKGILPKKGATGPEGNKIKQCQVLFDILDVGVDADIIEDIVKHPVITTMILKKWEKTKYFYWLTAFMYALFLMSYSFLIFDLFGDNYGIRTIDGAYYNEQCPNSTAKYADEIKNLTACQFRDPICNMGKF